MAEPKKPTSGLARTQYRERREARCDASPGPRGSALLIGRVQAAPLMRLPDVLVPLAEEAGMVTTVEVGATIPANLGRPGGPVAVNDLQAAQVARTAGHDDEGAEDGMER